MYEDIINKYGVFVEQDGTQVVLKKTALNIVSSILHACDTESNIHPLAQFKKHSLYEKSSTCRCGKTKCYEMARIQNIFTDVVVDSIGSSCIEEKFDYNNIRTWIRTERSNAGKLKRAVLKKAMIQYGERMWAGKTLNEFVRFEKKVRRQIPEYVTKMETLIKSIKDEDLIKYFKYSLKNKI